MQQKSEASTKSYFRCEKTSVVDVYEFRRWIDTSLRRVRRIDMRLKPFGVQALGFGYFLHSKGVWHREPFTRLARRGFHSLPIKPFGD